MKPIRLTILVLALPLATFAADRAAQADSDRDGLADNLEQQLLERFRPRFMASASDCAGVPAKIKAGQVQPEVEAVDGTIYGQAFPSLVRKGTVEIHYYTIWSHDCGRMSHRSDVEHVAALVDVDGQEQRALYWYAGAHEKTICDISSGARAEALDAEERGPKVWSASGKHALYLRQEMCHTGCGPDSCEDNVEVKRNGPVINLGERGVPANDLLWVDSTSWILPEKMQADFSPGVIATLEESPKESVVTLKGSSTIRGTIQGSDKVLDGAGAGASETSSALGSANDHASTGVVKATRATGRGLKRAWKTVFGGKE